MQGFNSKFKDFPDYILGITKEIWEDRGIATLHEYYSTDIIVRSPSAVVIGNENVISATMSTLAEFPDRTLLGEDVIWSGTPEEGMLSSHRILSQATHNGDGVYGKATGKKLVYRIIADCHAINNQINDEWLIRDQGAIVRQMGWTAKDYAASMIAKEGGADKCTRPLCPAIDRQGAYLGHGNDNEWGQKYADNLRKIMTADFSVIPDCYDRAIQAEIPGGRTIHGLENIDSFWMQLRAAFPNAELRIDHQIGRDDPMMPPRAALRWSLHGIHEGWGGFGEPTGAEIYILGISHAEFGPYGIKREFILFDETAVWKQILMHSQR